MTRRKNSDIPWTITREMDDRPARQQGARSFVFREDSLDGLTRVIDALNSDKHSELRRIVTAWQTSGPSLIEMNRADRASGGDLWMELQLLAQRTQLAPSWTGGTHLIVFPYPEAKDLKKLARMLFITLITNPLWDKLAGPCARCGKYYIKKTARQKAYCSRACGTHLTAKEATRRRREDYHRDKLHRAAETAAKWTTARTRLDWKHWVSQRHSDITPKFLTRAVNKSEITEPKKVR
jgi:hypothetical protein